MNTQLGLEVFLDSQTDVVKDKRVGLVACPSSVDHDLRSSVELLYEHPAVNLVALFGPEHGLRGDAQAGNHVGTYVDALTNLPVHSLYGETHKPSAEMLDNLDTLVIDLQDGGVRFYTYLATITNVMQAASEQGKSVIILDRPAPITASRIEGPMLDPEFSSFVGPYPTPIRYGMTIGEISGLMNDHYEIGCDLTVIQMENWTRDQWYDETDMPFIPSSPNLPTLDSMIAYPGTCLIEGTTMSEGRGTTKPFEYIGAPWINAESLAKTLNDLELAGVRFRPVYFVPTFSKYQGELCAGVHVYITDRDRFLPITAILHLISIVKTTYPNDFAWRQPWDSAKRNPIDLLSGGTLMREHFDANRSVAELVESWQDGLQTFAQLRAKYLLYPAE